MMKRSILLAVVSLFLRTGSAQQFSPRYELVKMGPEVNTKAYHEMSPVISTDGKKLYFVENNRPENAMHTARTTARISGFPTLTKKGFGRSRDGWAPH